MIGHPWSTSVLPHRKNLCNFEEKNRWLYFSNEPTRPEGGAKIIEKDHHTFTCLRNGGKDTTLVLLHPFLNHWWFIHGAIYSQKAPFFSKLHLSPTQWNWRTTFPAFWRPAHYWIKKTFVQTKNCCIWGTEFYPFKMDVIKWYLNLVSYNHSCDFISNACCTLLWFWNHSYAHMISDVTTHVIMSRKFCGAERSRRCTHTCGAFEYTRLFADLCDFTVTMHHPTKIISYCSIGWLGIFTCKFNGEDVFD